MGKRFINNRSIYIAIVIAAIGLGIGLRRHAFWDGLISDDYLQFAMLEGVYPVKRSPLDLYNFYRSSEEVKTLKQFGTLPWLSDPNFRLAMLRPLSSALIAFDYLAFGNHIWAFYLHSVFWWVLMLVAVAGVLAEVLPLPIAGLAVLLFAVDESSDITFCWLANRNTVVSIGLGVLGLWAFIRWFRGGGRKAFILSIALTVLALLAGEWVFSVFAYLFAYALWNQQRRVRSRVLALLPIGLLAICFVAAQSALGYGALHSSVYVSPFVDPGLFFSKATERVPIFFADLVLGIPTVWWFIDNPWRIYFLSHGFFHPSVWKILPGWKFFHILLGYTAIFVFIFIIRWSIRNLSAQVRQELRWLITGAVLSFIPLIASIPSERLTLPAAIGFCALFSAALIACAQALYRFITRPATVFPLGAAVILLYGCWFHGYRAVSRAQSESQAYRLVFESVAKWIERAPIDDSQIAQQRIVLINVADHTSAVFFPFVRYAHGHPLPLSQWTLSAAPYAHDVKRVSANALELTIVGAIGETDAGENFYRDERSAVKPGETFRIEGLGVQVVAATDGKVRRLRFTFDKPLEDSEYLFLCSSRLGLRRFDLPVLGKVIRLPRAQFPDQSLLPKTSLHFRDPVRTRQHLFHLIGLR
jgi:hypothetical protein